MIDLFMIMIISHAAMFIIYSIDVLSFYYLIVIILCCIIRNHYKACHWMPRFDLTGQFKYYYH